MAEPRRAPQTLSSFDTDMDKPSMGDPEFVDGRVRVMLDEVKDILFTHPNPQSQVQGLIDKWATEFSPANEAYIQTLSVAALDAWLRSKGCGVEDNAAGDPLKAMLAHMIGRFVEAATSFHEGKIDGSMMQFETDSCIEDTVALLQGLDNPAD